MPPAPNAQEIIAQRTKTAKHYRNTTARAGSCRIGFRERFEVLLPFMFARLDAMGFEGLLDVTTTAVDGVNNRYEAKPFSVNLENRPEPD